MARMHSGAKGKSGSKRPLTPTPTPWVSYKPKEIEMLIIKLSKQGLSAALIGATLRDTYGIPSVKQATQKSIQSILTEKKLSKKLPEDLIALIRRFVSLSKHIGDNNQDKTAKRGLTLTVSKINRLVTYYKNAGTISKDWKFDRKQASFYLE